MSLLDHIIHSPIALGIWAEEQMTILARLSQFTLAVILIVSCTACATGGRDFNYKPVPTLEIGSLSSTDYQDIFGKPLRAKTTTNSDGTFEGVMFQYTQVNMATSMGRFLGMEFRDGRLNAWLYISTFDDDRTAVDLAATDKIRKTISTKSEVQRVLGKPHGKALCPSLIEDYKDRCKSAELWAWAGTNGPVTLGQGGRELSTIFILFDRDGIVTQIETDQQTVEPKTP
jgi:hypothetical protein